MIKLIDIINELSDFARKQLARKRKFYMVNLNNGAEEKVTDLSGKNTTKKSKKKKKEF